MADKFPFNLEDIAFWIVRRKDGTSVKYTLTDSVEGKRVSTPVKAAGSTWTYHGCAHEPMPVGVNAVPPVFAAHGIGLWIADGAGSRKVYQSYDVAIDGGQALPVFASDDLPNMYGDATLRAKLSKHVVGQEEAKVLSGPRIIKLRWYDREAPPVWSSFWPALTEELKLMAKKKAKLTPEDPILRVLTICQGGHGRSGTALCCLMMCLSNYSPLEALTHIRAIHCPRAIESKVQHQYLNAVGLELGREDDALNTDGISSWKEKFLQSTNPVSLSYFDRVSVGTTEVSRKNDPFCAM